MRDFVSGILSRFRVQGTVDMFDITTYYRLD